MSITSYARANQLIPISKARANLSSLVENVSEQDFLVLMKKYQPKAVLVDLTFFDKLVEVYEQWKRKQDFIALNKIRDSIPTYKSAEVERDIKDAIKAIRKKV